MIDTMKSAIDAGGVVTVIAGIFTNLDNITSLLLAIGGVVYLGFKIRGLFLDNKLKQKKLQKDEDFKTN